MKTKRILAMLLSVVMMFSVMQPAFAATSVSTIFNSDFEEYAMDAVQRYIGVCGTDLSQAELGLSQPLQSYNGADNARIFFLFDGDSCIGELAVAYVNGEFASSFTLGDFSPVTDAYKESEPFSLITQGEALLLATNISTEVISGVVDYAETISTFTQEHDEASLQKEVLTLTPFACPVIPASSTRGAVGDGKTLNVTHVGNADSPDTDEGLCWAASLAMIIMYKTHETGITALSLYKELKDHSLASDFPCGEESWIRLALELHGFSESDIYHEMVGLSFIEVMNLIVNDRPIYCGIKNTRFAHAVVICGYSQGYGYNYYRLDDPNINGTVLVQLLPSAAATTFTYSVPNGYIYNTWYRTCYCY